MGAPNLISIIGTVFCGSTVVGNVLEGMINNLFIGEVNRFSYNGNDFREYDSVFRASLQDDSFLNVVNPGRCNKFWSNVSLGVEDIGGLIRNISTSMQIESGWILEDSKFPDWTDYLLENGVKPKLQVLLFRSPLDWVLSICKASLSPTVDANAIIDEYVDVYSWHIINAIFYSIPFIPISFERFSRRPEHYARSIQNFQSGHTGMGKVNLDRCVSLHVDFDYASHAIGGNAKGYFIIEEMQALLMQQDLHGIRELIGRYSSTTPKQLDDICQDTSKFFHVKKMSECDIESNIDTLRKCYSLTDERCGRLRQLYDWMVEMDNIIVRSTPINHLPSFIRPLCTPSDHKVSTASTRNICYVDLNDSFPTFDDSSFSFQTPPNHLRLSQHLEKLTSLLKDRLAWRDQVIASQSLQIKSMRDELLRAEAQLDLLKDCLLGGRQEDRL